MKSLEETPFFPPKAPACLRVARKNQFWDRCEWDCRPFFFDKIKSEEWCPQNDVTTGYRIGCGGYYRFHMNFSEITPWKSKIQQQKHKKKHENPKHLRHF